MAASCQKKFYWLKMKLMGCLSSGENLELEKVGEKHLGQIFRPDSPKIPTYFGMIFSKFLLTSFEDKGQTVMLAPATGFYSTPGYGKNEVRVAFVLNEKKLLRGTKIIRKGIKKYNKIYASPVV